MLRNSSFFLALAASTLVSGSPAVFRQAAGPPTSTSNGFQLVANVTDPFNALALLVQNMVLQAYHAGAGYSVAVLHHIDAKNPGRVFYLNSPPSAPSSLLTDSGGAPSVPFGLSVQSPTEHIAPQYPDEHGVSLTAGGGTAVTLANTGAPYGGIFVDNAQGGGTFLACNRTIPYYNNMYGITVEYVYREAGTPAPPAPEGCVPIRLVPQCAALAAVPAGSKSSHQFAQTVPCYTGAAAI